MKIYKANKYYTTMNYDTFLILGTDESVLKKAHELQLECIADNSEENCTKVNEFIELNKLMYLDDVSEPMEIGKIDDIYECAIDSNGKGYVYQVVNYCMSRF